jgi:hypothetical protein
VTCFASQSLEIKLTTTTKMSCAPFNIHKLNVQVVDEQLTNASCTYKLMIFSTNVGKTISSKAFLDGKTICG